VDHDAHYPPPHQPPPVFFFQAEDGIRDRNVTGVHTCALPILSTTRTSGAGTITSTPAEVTPSEPDAPRVSTTSAGPAAAHRRTRSEERRVGKECGSRRWAGDA